MVVATWSLIGCSSRTLKRWTQPFPLRLHQQPTGARERLAQVRLAGDVVGCLRSQPAKCGTRPLGRSRVGLVGSQHEAQVCVLVLGLTAAGCDGNDDNVPQGSVGPGPEIGKPGLLPGLAQRDR